MFKRVLTLAFVALTLSACKTTEPPKEVMLTNSPKVTYKLPLDQSVDIQFDTYNRCVSRGDSGCVRYDQIKFGRDRGAVVVERRTHNGISGSGAVYRIDETTERTAESSLVTYQPVKMSPYQQGLILPFPVPSLNITQYLSNTQFKTKFEIDSDYPSDSVKANFDRLMNKARRSFTIYGNTNSNLDLEDYYMVDLPGAQVVMLVESFPYRNGSKVVVNAIIQTKQSSTGVIDVATIVESLKGKVDEVVKS